MKKILFFGKMSKVNKEDSEKLLNVLIVLIKEIEANPWIIGRDKIVTCEPRK